MKPIAIALFAAMLGVPAWAAEAAAPAVQPAPAAPAANPAAAKAGGAGPNRLQHPGQARQRPTPGGAQADAAGHPAKDAKAKPAGPAAKKGDVADAKPREKDKDKEKEKSADSDKGNEEKLDYIEMITGDKMYGKIHKEFPDNVVLMINNDVGRIVVPRNRIKALNYSMDTRLAALEEGDDAGKFKVGLWAIEKSMYPQAIALFENMKGDNELEGVDMGELNKQLGKAYDAQHQSDKALEVFNEYKQGWKEGFVDAEINEAIKRLDLEVHPPVVETAKPAAAKIVDGLEADGNWIAEAWDNANACTCASSTDPTSGNKMIAVKSMGGTKDKMAFSRYGQPLDLRESSEMVFKIFNKSDQPINMACAFVNAQGDFHESKQIKIQPKSWLNESFKVEGKVFKSNRNDFKEWNLDLQGRDHISRITFLVYGQKPFTLYLDSLFFKEAKAN